MQLLPTLGKARSLLTKYSGAAGDLRWAEHEKRLLLSPWDQHINSMRSNKFDRFEGLKL